MPPIEELGLGIVDTEIIREYREERLRAREDFLFEHVYPNYIDSIRKLICCSKVLPKTIRQYKREEISTDRYEMIYNRNNKNYENYPNYEFKKIISGHARIRMIINLE